MYGKRYNTAIYENELLKVEKDIEDAANRTREMADELGARYAVFRCRNKRYDDGREEHNSDIIDLSRKADECIEMIYVLEQRRKELLDRIGK